MTRLRAAEKFELAKAIASEVASQDNVRFAMLVGSLAHGRPSEDSDVDLAVLLAGNSRPDMRCEWRDGQMIGYEYFLLDELTGLPSVPLLHPMELREAGRLATGQILYSTGCEIDSIIGRLRRSLLHPADSRDLFQDIGRALHAVEIDSSLPLSRRLWILQGVLSGLAILSLNLIPIRYQKSKWVVQDLAQTSDPALLEALRLLFPPREESHSGASSLIDQCTQAVEDGFVRLGIQPETYEYGGDYDLDYVRRTYLDAVSLFHDDQWTACGFTGTTAFRLLSTLLEHRQVLTGVDDGDLERHRRQWLERFFGPEELEETPVDAAVDMLFECRERLLGKYRDLYGATGVLHTV